MNRNPFPEHDLIVLELNALAARSIENLTLYGCSKQSIDIVAAALAEQTRLLRASYEDEARRAQPHSAEAGFVVGTVQRFEVIDGGMS